MKRSAANRRAARVRRTELHREETFQSETDPISRQRVHRCLAKQNIEGKEKGILSYVGHTVSLSVWKSLSLLDTEAGTWRSAVRNDTSSFPASLFISEPCHVLTVTQTSSAVTSSTELWILVFLLLLLGKVAWPWIVLLFCNGRLPSNVSVPESPLVMRQILKPYSTKGKKE